MNVGCAGTSSPSLLSNHCASLSLPLSLSLSPGKNSVARNLIPAGSGQQSWQQDDRAFKKSEGFLKTSYIKCREKFIFIILSVHGNRVSDS